MKLRELLNEMAKLSEENKISVPKIVGGAARDKYLGKLEDIADLDITTGDTSIEYLIKEVSILLGKNYNFKLKKSPTGYSTLTLGNLKIDFSAHFVIPQIDQILAGMKIEKPTDMMKELYSRDFNCNTLLMGMDLKTITDETGKAIPDIKEKIIRTCLSPKITFTSNKNRVIRSIYLASKLDFRIDNSIIEYVRQNPNSVRFASDHTLREKLHKAFQFNPDLTTHYLDQMGLWSYIPISEELQPYYLKRKEK